MRNPLKRFLERRQEKKQLREMLRVLRMYAWLEKMFDSGVLHYDSDNRRLVMEQSLAVLLMQRGAEGWVNAVREIYRYVHFRLTQKAWDDYMHREEVKAVRGALNQGGNLNRDDIERIKSARRMEIAQTDMKPPKVEAFEFFVVGTEEGRTEEGRTDSTDSTDIAAIGRHREGRTEGTEKVAGGVIRLVGHYDPQTEHMDLASWEEVSLFLNQNEE